MKTEMRSEITYHKTTVKQSKAMKTEMRSEITYHKTTVKQSKEMKTEMRSEITYLFQLSYAVFLSSAWKECWCDSHLLIDTMKSVLPSLCEGLFVDHGGVGVTRDSFCPLTKCLE